MRLNVVIFAFLLSEKCVLNSQSRSSKADWRLRCHDVVQHKPYESMAKSSVNPNPQKQALQPVLDARIEVLVNCSPSKAAVLSLVTLLPPPAIDIRTK